MSHFEGKSAIAHVFAARAKGKQVLAEPHGLELPGHYSAAIDAAKETAFLLSLLWLLLPTPFPTLWIVAAGWLLWKVGRSACLGWARLERLHRLIEEERWEIEHHRAQERSELVALYKAKGFSGQLLEEVIDVLMADDNRLLLVMLEEELGLNLEMMEHPLKQAAGAGVGTLIVAALLLGASLLPAKESVFLCGALIIGVTAAVAARADRNHLIPAIIWNLAVAALAAGVAYFVTKLL